MKRYFDKQSSFASSPSSFSPSLQHQQLPCTAPILDFGPDSVLKVRLPFRSLFDAQASGSLVTLFASFDSLAQSASRLASVPRQLCAFTIYTSTLDIHRTRLNRPYLAHSASQAHLLPNTASTVSALSASQSGPHAVTSSLILHRSRFCSFEASLFNGYTHLTNHTPTDNVSPFQDRITLDPICFQLSHHLVGSRSRTPFAGVSQLGVLPDLLLLEALDPPLLWLRLPRPSFKPRWTSTRPRSPSLARSVPAHSLPTLPIRM